MEEVKNGDERRGRDRGTDLLPVVLEAFHIMLQARPRFASLWACGLARLGAERMHRNMALPRHIHYAGANGGSGVVREEHHRQR